MHFDSIVSTIVLTLFSSLCVKKLNRNETSQALKKKEKTQKNTTEPSELLENLASRGRQCITDEFRVTKGSFLQCLVLLWFYLNISVHFAMQCCHHRLETKCSASVLFSTCIAPIDIFLLPKILGWEIHFSPCWQLEALCFRFRLECPGVSKCVWLCEWSWV